jgi:DNA polymerase III sliding clamp (beta) subunit (PCNA family)
MDAATADEVEIFEEDAYLVFKFQSNIFFTRKVSVQFPDVWKRIDGPTKEGNTQLLTFKVKTLKEVVQRVALTAAEDTCAMVMTLITSTDLKVSAKDSKDFSSEEVTQVKTDGIELGEEPLEFGINYSYLLEILSKVSGEEVTLKMSDNIRTPMRIDEGKCTIFVMRSLY